MYRQLYDWFQRAIVSGQLRPGQRVPSTRSLAAELKVSRVPVLSAFEQLHAEGYLETFVGAGTCVASSIPGDASKPAPGAARKPATQKISRKISQRARELLSMQGDSDLKNIGAFRVSLPALDYFPVGVWSSLLSRHSRNSTREMMAYGDPMGYAPFREAIAEYLGASRAVRCDASQVIVVPGSQLGLQVTARALLDLDDPVWIEEPGYPGAQQALTMAGARLVPVPIDRDGLDVKEGMRRCRNARAVYITPSHQYPMGFTMSASRRMQLLNWAARNGSWIIEDDYDSEYRFGSHPVASLQGMDADARVIYIGTLSKVLFPALRLGYVVVPKDLDPRILFRARSHRHFSAHPLPGGPHRFHQGRPLRPPHSQNAHALHGTPQGSRRSDSQASRRAARSSRRRSRNASGGVAAARSERQNSFAKSRRSRHLRNSAFQLLSEAPVARRLGPRLRRRK